MDNPKFWAQTNNMEAEAKRMLAGSIILDYGLSQIQLADPEYPCELDFSTPLVAETLTEEGLKEIGSKKRVRGPKKATQDLEECRAKKNKLLGEK